MLWYGGTVPSNGACFSLEREKRPRPRNVAISEATATSHRKTQALWLPSDVTAFAQFSHNNNVYNGGGTIHTILHAEHARTYDC